MICYNRKEQKTIKKKIKSISREVNVRGLAINRRKSCENREERKRRRARTVELGIIFTNFKRCF